MNTIKKIKKQKRPAQTSTLHAWSHCSPCCSMSQDLACPLKVESRIVLFSYDQVKISVSFLKAKDVIQNGTLQSPYVTAFADRMFCDLFTNLEIGSAVSNLNKSFKLLNLQKFKMLH